MILPLFYSMLRFAPTLLYGAMGGLLCERVGIATICLEGVLLFGAWVSASVSFWTGSALIGLFSAVCLGSLLMCLHGFFCLNLKIDSILSGLAINILALGAPIVLNKWCFDSLNYTPQLSPQVAFGIADAGRVFGAPSFRGFPLSLFIVMAFILPFFVHFIFFRTRAGLSLLACGENREAFRASGGSVSRTSYRTLMVGGAITGVGGAYLSTVMTSQFTHGMTAGRGYMALIAIIFGAWKPIPTFFVCLFFALIEGFKISLQGILGEMGIPVSVVEMIPYVVTLLVLLLVRRREGYEGPT